MPSLLFTMPLDKGEQPINKGRLVLVSDDHAIIGRWVATSGLAEYQKPGDWNHRRGGIIPATYQCKPAIPYYWVSTAPLDLRHLRGIQSNAYKIDPHSVTTEDGTSRGDFLIHRDANVPGSLGCIVLPDLEWGDFVNAMAKLTVDRLKLLVVYAY